MTRPPLPIIKIACLFLILLLVTFFFTWWLVLRTSDVEVASFDRPFPQSLRTQVDSNDYYELKTPYETYRFNLVAPEAAPEEIRDKVMFGHRIMTETKAYAPEYSGDDLSCINCHFRAGNTFGGKNGSISLVGVTNWYPTYSQRAGKTIDLGDRINNCFMRSINGKPLPKDSPEMEAIVAYLSWISKDVEHLKKTPWRGLIPLHIDHEPDLRNGAILYQEKCATCHQGDGQGVYKKQGYLFIPPLWGPDSFNDGAGMSVLKKLSSFIYYNMPYQEPTLTKEESIDVAGFISEQDRPVFKKQP